MFKKSNPDKRIDGIYANCEPVLKASICNGERVAGFRDINTGKFYEIMLINCIRDLEEFKAKYRIKGDIKTIY